MTESLLRESPQVKVFDAAIGFQTVRALMSSCRASPLTDEIVFGCHDDSLRSHRGGDILRGTGPRCHFFFYSPSDRIEDLDANDFSCPYEQITPQLKTRPLPCEERLFIFLSER